MKKLYLIRHAKSDWNDESENDFERGLNVRGEKAIDTMAEVLNKKAIKPDLILSSSATRAKLTTQGLSKKIDYKGKIKYLDILYLAEPLAVIEIIKKIKDKYDTVFIVGHNPETTELTDLMIDDYIDNVPTLGIVAFNVPVKHWKKFKPEKAKLDFYIYPKMFNS
jgi:phosphohistidine phosphatase